MFFNSKNTPEALARLLAAKGIDPAVASVFARVPRDRFVPEDLLDCAYEDRALPIGSGQTISQPYIVALMVQALRLQRQDRVLEIGTGSGYETAILAAVCESVYSVERIPDLLEQAMQLLQTLGVTGVRFRLGDGSLGWPEEAPFDRIIVSAAAPRVPRALCGQLGDGGRMVIPVGGERHQQLLLVRRTEDGFETDVLCQCAFVKLVGDQGYEGAG